MSSIPVPGHLSSLLASFLYVDQQEKRHSLWSKMYRYLDQTQKNMEDFQKPADLLITGP